MFHNYINTVNCAFSDAKHAPYQRVLGFQNFVLFRGTRVIVILFILVVKVEHSPHPFSLNSQILNGILYRTPCPGLTKIG